MSIKPNELFDVDRLVEILSFVDGLFANNPLWDYC